MFFKTSIYIYISKFMWSHFKQDNFLISFVKTKLYENILKENRNFSHKKKYIHYLMKQFHNIVSVSQYNQC